LSFYGGQDPLVPATQGGLLKDALDDAGVYNEFNFYENGGHADWDQQTMQEVFGKITVFLQAKL
jgi:predicted esterase